MSKDSTIQPSTILIVDDNPKNIQTLGVFLQTEGYQVEFAINGESALDWIKRATFDLILLDIMMPGMDGYEVCRIIKSDPKNQKIPIIFLTGKVDTESIISAFDLGAVDYIKKPFNQRELIARVKTQIEIKISREEIARNLRDIEHKNELITGSIQYAQRIQNALLPTEAIFKAYIPDNFILFLPKNIVSGDFYWTQQIEDIIFVAAADCTGHGIPGALMSMLGISLLNEIVMTKRVLETDEILNQMRDKLIGRLNQGNSEGAGIKDGLDIALISINLSQKLLTFSGANNPLIIVRKDTKSGETILIEHKADKMPISLHLKMKPFNKTTCHIMAKDKIYLFSDGYSDQFGGEENKKFSLNSLRQLFKSLYELPMIEQKQRLNEKFIEWKGNNKQLDDVVIVGLNMAESYGEVDFF
ncbi:MAG: response regulator [Bacteroidales bacterium]|nr:MAG: response regulator [Bacteroidales bacterium]